MHEVEQRALITAEDAERIRSSLITHGEQTRSFKRATLVQIDNEDFSVNMDGSYDLKIRNNDQDQLLFTVKQINAFNPTTRLESEVFLEIDQLESLLTNMKLLGYLYWIMTVESRQTFKYKGATFDLIHHHSIDKQILEIEVVAKSDSETHKAETIVAELFREFDCPIMDDEMLHTVLSQLNMAKDYQFDLSTISAKQLADKFRAGLE